MTTSTVDGSRFIPLASPALSLSPSLPASTRRATSIRLAWRRTERRVDEACLVQRRTDGGKATTNTIQVSKYRIDPPHHAIVPLLERSNNSFIEAMAPTTPRTIEIDPSDPSFTPQSLRVVELRSLLSSRNIVLPSSARKADLVKAVEEHITTPARKSSQLNAPPNGTSPEDQSLDDSANFSDYNPFQARVGAAGPSQPSPTPASARPVTSLKARKSLGVTPTDSSARDRELHSNRRKTLNPAALAARERPRSSAATPSAPASSPPSTPFSPYMDPSAAISSSPRIPTAVKPPIGEQSVKKQANTATEGPPVVRKVARKLAIVRPAKNDYWGFTRRLSSRLISLLFVVWWLWYVRDSKVIGYCDGAAGTTNRLLSDRLAAAQARKLSEDHAFSDLIPAFAAPSCTPCPPHAICARAELDRCESDEYVMQQSLLARIPLARSLVPLGWQSSYCKTDSRRLELIDELAGEIFRRVSLQVGSVLCGSTKPSSSLLEAADAAATSHSAGSSKSEVAHRKREYAHGLLESSLHDLLSDLRDSEHISQAYFDQLWTAAMEELEETSGSDQTWQTIAVPRRDHSIGDTADKIAQPSDRILLVDRMVATMPLSCRFRLFLASAARAATAYVLAAVSLLAMTILARARWRRSRYEAATVNALTNEVVSRLVEQNLNASFESDVPAGLPASHLRDALLDEYVSNSNKAQKKRVWSAVAKRVEGNSNVRTATKRWTRSGDWMRIWEWVGVVASSSSAAASAGTPRQSRPSTPSSGLLRARPSSASSQAIGEVPRDKVEEPTEQDESGVSGEMEQKAGTSNVSFG